MFLFTSRITGRFRIDLPPGAPGTSRLIRVGLSLLDVGLFLGDGLSLRLDILRLDTSRRRKLAHVRIAS